MDDPVSDVLRLIKLKSCLYFLRDFWSPWAMEIPSGPFAQFHLVVRGDCIVEVEGCRHDARAGDVLLFPHGQGHVLADRAGREAVPGPAVMASFAGAAPYFAEGERAAQLICGHYEYRGDTRHPVIEQLPSFLHLKAFDSLSPGSVDSILPLLVREMQDDEPGRASVLERLAEVLLIQVLRSYFRNEPRPRGFWAGLGDRRLARAIRLIHGSDGEVPNLESLAAAAGMSRSSFAQHFKQRIGLSPIDYLTKWRLIRASDLLQTSGLPLGRVAEQIGYDSEVSFSRAFKREFKVSPSEFKRRARLERA